MPKIFEMPHEILYYEADATGKLSLPNILNLAILSSTKQTDELGVGPDYTHDLGLGWIILQHNMTITRRPAIGETIILQTQAREANPFFCMRDYTFIDASGQVIVQIDSMYAMIDMQKRKVARIPEGYVDVFEPIVVKKIPRLPEPQLIAEDEQVDIEQDYRVRFTDIDSNQHVNNSKYFDWVQDVLGDGYIRTHEAVSVNIKFEQEVRSGNIISSRVVKQGDVTKHQIYNGEILAAEASVSWVANAQKVTDTKEI
ncbi:MAG: acyl-ACP thioesterase [Lactobacillaceae bacterium]|jgi:medium-chain acyl-[acyl-carrier-protein] hydrolase|nr:acyl-ACP thioesterase [Lactobacillaceae bacterium]